jgi:hypothetical protein
MGWQYALLGLAGALIQRALIFLEANRQAKGPAWRYPEGPGPFFFILATALHGAIAATVTYVAADAGYIHNYLIGLGLGIAAPVAVKRISSIALGALPPAGPPDGEESAEDDAATPAGGKT